MSSSVDLPQGAPVIEMAEVDLPTGVHWLPSVCRVLHSLQSLISSSYGPCGADRICRTEVGKIIITNSGVTILEQIEQKGKGGGDPIAIYLLTALRTHRQLAGDGSSSVLLMLAASMREIYEQVQGKLGIHASTDEVFPTSSFHSSSTAAASSSSSPFLLTQSRRRRLRLLHALQTIHRHWLLEGALERWLVTHKAKTISPASKADETELRTAVTGVIRTMIGHKLSPSAATTLSTCLTDLIFTSRASSAQPLHEVARDLVDDFTFHLCPGVSLAESKLLNGFLFPGSVGLRTMRTELQQPRTLILHCDLHSGPKKYSVNGELKIETKSTAESLAFLVAGEQSLTRWIERLRSDHVQLVLSTYKLHDATLAALGAADIVVVHALDEFDTRRMAKYARTIPVTSMEEYEDPSSGPLPIVTLGAFTQVMVGNQILVHIEMKPDSTSPSSQPHLSLIKGHTLLLCGANEAMCQQYSQMLQRGLKLIQDWSETSLAYCEAALTNSSTPTVKTTVQSPLPTSKSSNSMFGAMKGGFFASTSKKPTQGTASLTPSPAATSSPASSSPPSLHVVGGGGSIELSLLLFCQDQARVISKTTHKTHPLLPSSNVINDDADYSGAFQVIAAGLSSVLQILLNNSTSAAAREDDNNKSIPWLKIQPHLRSIHDHSGLRNLGFGLINVLTPPQYQPLHQTIPKLASRTPNETLSLQTLVATSEVALLSLLPPIFTLNDTLTSSTTTPLLEPVSLKLQILSTYFNVLFTLLKVEGLVGVKSVASMNSSKLDADGSLAGLNLRPSRPGRGWIRRRDAWNETEGDDSNEDRDSSPDELDSD